MKKLALAIATSTALLAASSAAMAHQAGDIFVRGGPILVVPNTDTHRYANNALPYDFDVNSNLQLGLTGTYMITDNLGVELLAATPFSHEIKQAGLGTIAKTKQLPPSLYVQYYFLNADSPARPYVGAGINYTTFFNEKFTSTISNTDFSAFGLPKIDAKNLKLKDSWGPVVNAGIDIKLTDNLFLNTSIWWAKIKTKAKFDVYDQASGQFLTSQEARVTLDPTVFFVGLGYKF
ncbi:membrane protein [Gallibacterium salpingitidis]|uniref:Membrane protein n=1 Tax=Gallibacterium salpingitidis TaxID=505341 RepID=A0A1A7P1R5_9PAST|nr:OmpW family outer membrane protein [Gallibacterium salpingitidis]OBW95681.1 membrane protein [Gallibacterium salpingitidis]OBX05318.1 membrane protein [Gallibacterium salpingitidis]OBX10042.1 membrane protein [Gallibacterium salpingitidis]